MSTPEQPQNQDNQESIRTGTSVESLKRAHLANNCVNLGIANDAKQAAVELGQDFEQLLEQEEEPGLGNGGLGRLAACYMDSLATLLIPSIGYGIRYQYGIFDQEINDGWQHDQSYPDYPKR